MDRMSIRLWGILTTVSAFIDIGVDIVDQSR